MVCFSTSVTEDQPGACHTSNTIKHYSGSWEYWSKQSKEPCPHGTHNCRSEKTETINVKCNGWVIHLVHQKVRGTTEKESKASHFRVGQREAGCDVKQEGQVGRVPFWQLDFTRSHSSSHLSNMPLVFRKQQYQWITRGRYKGCAHYWEYDPNLNSPTSLFIRNNPS